MGWPSPLYVTRFAKMCIFHASTFLILKVYKISYAHQTDMKLAGIVQKISDLNVFPIMFYGLLTVQNQMCELCTFSRMQSHILSNSHTQLLF